jgi:hypothetical protein
VRCVDKGFRKLRVELTEGAIGVRDGDKVLDVVEDVEGEVGGLKGGHTVRRPVGSEHGQVVTMIGSGQY